MRSVCPSFLFIFNNSVGPNTSIVCTSNLFLFHPIPLKTRNRLIDDTHNLYTYGYHTKIKSETRSMFFKHFPVENFQAGFILDGRNLGIIEIVMSHQSKTRKHYFEASKMEVVSAKFRFSW